MARDVPSSSARLGRTEPPGFHGRRLERAQARAMVHHLRWGFILRNIHDKRNSFCTLTVKETDEGERAMAAWFGRLLAVVTGSSDGPPVTRTGWTYSLHSHLAPPGGDKLNSHDKKSLAARVWCCGQKFDEYVPLFIGVLGPTHRGDGVLHFLSINWTLIRLHLEDFWKGMNLGLVTVWKLNFTAGLTQLRKIPYPESVHRVWSG
jgi:hypothetical protein